jgi:hypothetical protein
MKRTMGLLVSGLVALSLVSTAGIASAQGANATLHVLHAVPGATVDVCVDGAEVKSNFEYKQRFTAELPGGEYRVVVRAAGAGECTGDRIKGANVTLDGGTNSTAVAGLSKRGSVKLFAFANDVRDLRNGVARVEVRHVAAAPRVDVWVNGAPAIRKIPNGAEAKVKLPAGDYTVRVAPAGTRTTVIGPRTFDLSGGTAYQVFATGNADAGFNFLVLAQKV